MLGHTVRQAGALCCETYFTPTGGPCYKKRQKPPEPSKRPWKSEVRKPPAGREDPEMNVICFEQFPAAAALAPDEKGLEHVTVVLKATFEIGSSGELRPAREQVPLVYSDEHHGEPGTSSVRYENDFAPFKPRCDVILNGSAHAPGGKPVKELDVSVSLGSMKKTARVYGDRAWVPQLLGSPLISDPVPFVRTPLTWERAFGGSDLRAPDPKEHLFDARNPVGVGLYSRLDRGTGSPHRLPNIEDPASPIHSLRDRPVPRGFGFVGRGWQPRLQHGGTYDEQWQQARFPFLPDDFDELYYQGAPEDQICPYPQGGEWVDLVNLSPEGVLHFQLPRLTFPIVVPFRPRERSLEPHLDTVIIEPDERRVLLVWRARTPCLGKPTDIRVIRVGTPSRAWLRAQSSAKAYVDWRRFFPPQGQ